MAEVDLERSNLEGAERHLHQALALVERDPEEAISLEAALLRIEFRLRRDQAARALEEIADLKPGSTTRATDSSNFTWHACACAPTRHSVRAASLRACNAGSTR